MQKLMGFAPAHDLPGVETPNQFQVYTSSSIFSCADKQSQSVLRRLSTGVVISESSLASYIEAVLSEKLREKLLPLSDELMRTRSLQQCCIDFMANRCNRNSCGRDHIPSSELTREGFNNRIAIHAQIILSLQNLWYIPRFVDGRTRARRWVDSMLCSDCHSDLLVESGLSDCLKFFIRQFTP